MVIPTLNALMLRKPIVYDFVLSVLYFWSVCQMYIYDAKQESGLVIYIITYGVFTLLVRSPFGALLMNVISGFSLVWLFKQPVMLDGSYFKFGAFFGILMTLGVLCVQVLVTNCLLIWGRTLVEQRNQFSWSVACAVVSAVVLTVMASVVNSRLI